MRNARGVSAVSLGVALVLRLGSVAWAQEGPPPEAKKPEEKVLSKDFAKAADRPGEAKGPAQAQWYITGQFGLLLNTGNSELVALSGSLASHWRDRWNKVSLDIGGSYAQSTFSTARDRDVPATGVGNGQIDDEGEVESVTSTTASNLLGRLRYDRYLTLNNSLYADYYAGFDRPAGKEFLTGGNVGYRRQLYNSARHLLAVEAGYNALYIQYYTPIDDSVTLHNLRLYAGYWLTINEWVAFTASVEALVNLNPVTVARLDYGFAEASKVLGGVGLTTRLWKVLSFRATFGVRYDNAPAARRSLSLPWAGEIDPVGFLPLAQRVDTTTQIALVVDLVK